MSKGLERVIVNLATPPSSSIESLSREKVTLGGSLSMTEKAIESFPTFVFGGPALIPVALK